MFYLNARGIDDESAKSLFVQAYIGDVLNSVTFEEIKNEVVRLTLKDTVGYDECQSGFSNSIERGERQRLVYLDSAASSQATMCH